MYWIVPCVLSLPIFVFCTIRSTIRRIRLHNRVRRMLDGGYAIFWVPTDDVNQTLDQNKPPKLWTYANSPGTIFSQYYVERHPLSCAVLPSESSVPVIFGASRASRVPFRPKVKKDDEKDGIILVLPVQMPGSPMQIALGTYVCDYSRQD